MRKYAVYKRHLRADTVLCFFLVGKGGCRANVHEDILTLCISLLKLLDSTPAGLKPPANLYIAWLADFDVSKNIC